MNPEIKAAWIAALRSGEYKQTQGELRNEDGYCCLGVLCDLHAKAGLGSWDQYLCYLNKSDLLPLKVVAWADLDGPNPKIKDTPLIVLNDGIEGHAPHTFDDIADLIEQEA